MKPSTKDQAEGKIHEVKGKIKEKLGKATRNPNLENEGTNEKTASKVQKKNGQVEKVLGISGPASVAEGGRLTGPDSRWPGSRAGACWRHWRVQSSSSVRDNLVLIARSCISMSFPQPAAHKRGRGEGGAM